MTKRKASKKYPKRGRPPFNNAWTLAEIWSMHLSDWSLGKIAERLNLISSDYHGYRWWWAEKRMNLRNTYITWTRQGVKNVLGRAEVAFLEEKKAYEEQKRLEELEAERLAPMIALKEKQKAELKAKQAAALEAKQKNPQWWDD